MAILELELAPGEQARLQREAQTAGVTVIDWARRKLFGPSVVTFTTDDGMAYESPDLPSDLGLATAVASKEVLKKFWVTPEEDVAWRST